MNCTNCEAKTIVEETRDSGEQVIRVRKCKTCDWRVTTLETYADEQSIPRAVRRPTEHKKGSE